MKNAPVQTTNESAADTANFNPIYPALDTLPARCLAMMLDGQAITHPEFNAATGSWRLSVVIYTLKGLGWPVESVDISVPSAECPHRFIISYSLPREVIDTVFGGGAR